MDKTELADEFLLDLREIARAAETECAHSERNCDIFVCPCPICVMERAASPTVIAALAEELLVAREAVNIAVTYHVRGMAELSSDRGMSPECLAGARLVGRGAARAFREAQVKLGKMLKEAARADA